MSLRSLMINYQFKKSDKRRDQGLMTPPDIKGINNIAYGKHGKWNLLDLYFPIGHKGKLPIIINIHGGGWVYGTKETYQYYLMSLAQEGFMVTNPNYRLAPQAKFPAQLEDINEVVNWVLAQKDNDRFDMEHIFLVGDSAGAHLAALYSILCTNEQYQRLLDV